MSNGNGRESHVKRVFLDSGDGTNLADLNPDAWIDVLRIDSLPVVYSGQDDGVEGQIIRYVLKWNDDPNNPDPDVDASHADVQGENANASRDTEQRKIRNPDSPDDSIDLWIVDRLWVTRAGEDTGEAGQLIHFVFNNTALGDTSGSEPPSDRETTAVKIVNNDLAGMRMSDADGGNPAIVAWADYQAALLDANAVTDSTQHLDVEITDRVNHVFNSDADTGKLGQVIGIILEGNDDVEALFDAGDRNAVDANGDPSLIRTDPLQIIVNAGFGGLAAEFGDKAMDSPGQAKKNL